MDKKSKDILKKGLMETSGDFTANLMDQIDTEERAFSNILNEHASMETSPDFTAQLMQKLEGKVPAKPYTPVISKKIWVGLAATFACVIVLVLFADTSGSSRFSFDKNIHQIADNIGSFFRGGSMFVYILVAALLLSIGLIVEQRISKTNHE